jgi:hypothetical protein
MVMKAVLDSLDGVDKAFQGEYKKADDGKFYLDLEGVDTHPSTQPLANAHKRTKDELTAARKDLGTYKTRSEELETEINGLREGAIPKGDVEALKKSYQTKYDKDIKERDDRINALGGTVQSLMVDNVATGLANKLAAKPEFSEVLLPHIRGRIKLEYGTDGTPSTVVLDKDGKPSALSLDDLEKEVLSNKAFAPILRGSHASGGNASGRSDGSSGAGNKKPIDPSKFDMSKASPAEIVAFRKQQAGQ